MPAAAAATSIALSGRSPGEVTTSCVPGGTSSAGPGHHVDAEGAQLVGRRPLAVVVAPADRDDPRAARGQHPGGRRTGDAETRDADPHAEQVRRRPGRPGPSVRVAQAPLTHSA